jgi:NADPH-dependent curcumin reductase CurA
LRRAGAGCTELCTSEASGDFAARTEREEALMAHAWYLKSRPVGMPTLDHFELRPLPLPAPEPGMVRVRNLWLSVDPYMRGRMSDARSYVAPYAVGEPLEGGAIGEVIGSTAEGLAPGDLVTHGLGWRDEAVGPATAFRKLPASGLPPQIYLSTLGMIGATAYFGLLSVGEAKAGETLFVSAAAGAVGSHVVQIAKIKGMRVVGSAGGPEKCALVVRELGADRAIDYKAPGPLSEKLAEAAPEGIDVYFDNVGGEHLDAALASARLGARFPICGMISSYNRTEPVALRNLMRIIAARIRIQGFLVGDFQGRLEAFYREMGQWVAEGRIIREETIMEGLETTPEAFLALFSGQNTGKMLVRL